MTERLYFDDSYLFQGKARVKSVAPGEGEHCVDLVLHETIFHPQGGGQPSDEGTIDGFAIRTLRADKETGVVVHTVAASGIGSFEVGQVVELRVDSAKRRENARNHSAGHLLDVAVRKAGLPLVPGKGYHFPTSAYVEYAGSVAAEERLSVAEELTKIANALIAGSSLTDRTRVTTDPQGMRIVRLIKEDDGCPCGGTHVQHIREIGRIKVTKVTKKQKNVRVCYEVLAPDGAPATPA